MLAACWWRAGSDTAYDGCWIIERNPNYPATQPEPWRIRNFRHWKGGRELRPALSGANLEVSGGDWLYIFGGRESQLVERRKHAIRRVTETTNHWSNKAHRINVVTGQMEGCRTCRYAWLMALLMYDELYDVFIITGKPWHPYP